MAITRLRNAIGFTLACAALFLSADTATIAAATGPSGFLGRPLAAAERSEFFRWFHLERADAKATTADAGALSFRPSGERFHDLTLVEVAVDPDGAIRRMDLVLRRVFIDGRRDGVFARDIAKSFLRDVSDHGDAAMIGELANEIEYGGEPSGNVIVGPGYHKPPLPSAPSPGYQAFLGARDSFRRKLNRCQLLIVNETDPGGGALRITLVVQ